MAGTAKIYLPDTNVLIGFSLWLPITLHDVFWAKFAESLERGEWILLDVVVKEIKYNPDLQKWCKDQEKKGLVKALLCLICLICFLGYREWDTNGTPCCVPFVPFCL